MTAAYGVKLRSQEVVQYSTSRTAAVTTLIRLSVRKVWVSLASGYPYVALFRQVHRKPCAVPLKC